MNLEFEKMFVEMPQEMKDAGIIVDDSDKVILERSYPWVKVPPGEGKIAIRVEELCA